MNRAAAAGMAVAIPVLCLAFFWLTRRVDPLAGYALGLCLYWCGVLVPLILLTSDRSRLRAMARPVWPGTALAAVSGVAIAVTAGAAALAGLPPAGIAALAILGALVNGTLEETFWRGTLLPDPALTLGAALPALVLFVTWHLALLFAEGVAVTGGGAGVMAGAAGFGLLAVLLRLRTGGFGTAAVVHVAFNVFAFLELASRNT